MATREQLQTKLEELLHSRNVYYQPPESVKLSFPAIVYSKDIVKKDSADDTMYGYMNRYTITVVSLEPDNPIIWEMLAWPYCSYDRSFRADNLYHDVLTLYF